MSMNKNEALPGFEPRSLESESNALTNYAITPHAPSGNRTRVESMATTHDTTTPMVLNVIVNITSMY